MNYMIDKLRLLPLAPALALVFAFACTDDSGEGEGESADSANDESGSSDTNESAEGNDSSMDTTGDGDGDTTGDGDGDTTGDGDGDTTGDGDGDTTGDGDGDTTGDGDGDTGGNNCDPMEAEAVGDCEAILGVAWNGVECVTLVGCECVGADCGALYEGPDACMAAHADCLGGNDCAGLGLEACTAAEACNPIMGGQLQPQGDAAWCTLAPTYLGCSSELGCGDAISFACADGEDGVFQTNDTCLPDEGWSACDPPNNQGFYEPCG